MLLRFHHSTYLVFNTVHSSNRDTLRMNTEGTDRIKNMNRDYTDPQTNTETVHNSETSHRIETIHNILNGSDNYTFIYPLSHFKPLPHYEDPPGCSHYHSLYHYRVSLDSLNWNVPTCSKN